MSNFDIIRAWKDDNYLESLTEEQRSQLPENPAGLVELSDEQMEAMTGGLNIESKHDCSIDSKSAVCISNIAGKC